MQVHLVIFAHIYDLKFTTVSSLLTLSLYGTRQGEGKDYQFHPDVGRRKHGKDKGADVLPADLLLYISVKDHFLLWVRNVTCPSIANVQNVSL